MPDRGCLVILLRQLEALPQRAGIDLAGGQHRNEEQRHPQRGQEREHYRQRHIAEDLPRHPLHKDHREEDRDGRKGGSGHRRAHLAGAPDHRGDQPVALLAAAEDAFDHHNGVVDQHPDPQRQASQRHDVERDVEQAHRGEGGDYRDRDRQPHDHRAAHIVEEEEQYDHRQDAPDQRGIFNFVDGVFDKHRLVGQQIKLHPFRQAIADEVGHRPFDDLLL